MANETVEPLALLRARRLARLFDSYFRMPGTQWRFGWDAVIGLIPGIGDLLSACTALYIIKLADDLNVPKWIRMRMWGNVIIDFTAGSVPVFGDLFDAAFKANMRNIALIESYRDKVPIRRPGIEPAS